MAFGLVAYRPKGGLAAAMILLLAFSPFASAEQQPAVDSGAVQAQNPDPSKPAPAESAPLPDSPGAVPVAQPQPAPQQTPQSSSPPPAASQQQGPSQKTQPIGTAAAGIENTAGIAASKPAGVALAPPKQHRVRLLVIKLGAIAGAGVALGSVVALSKASPSKPPGSH